MLCRVVDAHNPVFRGAPTRAGQARLGGSEPVAVGRAIHAPGGVVHVSGAGAANSDRAPGASGARDAKVWGLPHRAIPRRGSVLYSGHPHVAAEGSPKPRSDQGRHGVRGHRSRSPEAGRDARTSTSSFSEGIPYKPMPFTLSRLGGHLNSFCFSQDLAEFHVSEYPFRGAGFFNCSSGPMFLGGSPAVSSRARYRSHETCRGVARSQQRFGLLPSGMRLTPRSPPRLPAGFRRAREM